MIDNNSYARNIKNKLRFLSLISKKKKKSSDLQTTNPRMSSTLKLTPYTTSLFHIIPLKISKGTIHSLKTMVENLKWKSESGERERCKSDIVFSDYRGREKMFSWRAIEILKGKIVF